MYDILSAVEHKRRYLKKKKHVYIQINVTGVQCGLDRSDPQNIACSFVFHIQRHQVCDNMSVNKWRQNF